MDGCARNDLDLRFAAGPMIHVKAMLVDDRELLLGSANFDFLSASLQPEVLVAVRKAESIGDFRRRVLEPDLVRSRVWDRDEIAPLPARLGTEVMGLARAVLTGIHER